MALAEISGFDCAKNVNLNVADPLFKVPSHHMAEMDIFSSAKSKAHITPVPHGVKCNKTQIDFQHGTTTLAFKYQGGLVVATDSRASAGTYIASSDTDKVLRINKYLLGTMAGGAADCQYWHRVLSKQCRLFELRNGERISVAAASKLLTNMLYSYKNHGLSMAVMLAGYDKQGPGLYYIGDDGQRTKGDLFSFGSGSTYALGVLDSEFRFEQTYDEAINLAKRSITYATFRDGASGGFVNLFHMTADGWDHLGRFDTTDLFYEYKFKE